MKRARRGLKLKKQDLESNVDINYNIDPIDPAKLQKIRKVVSPDIAYNKIKFKNDIFSLGDCLMIRDVNEGVLIGKLIKIIPTGGISKYPYWPTIQVQWYYKKSDVNREKNGLQDDVIFNSISDFEVFKSTHTDTVFIETVMNHCKIYTYEEYESLEEHTNTTLFSRASYDPVKESFDPTFEKWETSCICRTPLNPDQLYIKCDKCEKWFHPTCCNLDENDVANLSEFYCKFCKEA